MATAQNAPSAALPCPACGSLRTRKARRLQRQDWIRKLGGGVAWRCRDCRRRFYLRPDGEVILARRKPGDLKPPRTQLWIFKGFRRIWRNSWRWRSRHVRIWERRIVVGLILLSAVIVFLIFLTRAPAGES